jgi:hypothetical protein
MAKTSQKWSLNLLLIVMQNFIAWIYWGHRNFKSNSSAEPLKSPHTSWSVKSLQENNQVIDS